MTFAEAAARPRALDNTRALAVRRGRHALGRAALWAVCAAGAVCAAFPLFWMIARSLKTDQEANGPRLVWWPASPQIGTYLTILADQAFQRSYFNSIFVAGLTLAGTLVSIAAVAYAFSRVDWPGRNVVFGLMLSTLMIPAQALIVPQYVTFSAINWVGTFIPVTIPGFFAGGAAMI